MPDPTRRELMARIATGMRLLQQATDAVDDAAAEHLGINRTDLRCLDILMFQGAITPSQLAAEAGVSAAATTTILDRLERAGYIERRRDDRDRRRLLIDVTDAAWSACEPIYSPLAEAAQSHLGRYTREHLEIIDRFLEHSRGVVESHVDDLRERHAEGD